MTSSPMYAINLVYNISRMKDDVTRWNKELVKWQLRAEKKVNTERRMPSLITRGIEHALLKIEEAHAELAVAEREYDDYEATLPGRKLAAYRSQFNQHP